MRRRRCVGARKFLERAGDVAIEPVERGLHFGGALAGQILKIARLENLRHPIPDVLREAALEIALQQSDEVVGRLIDVLGGAEDSVPGDVAVLDDGSEFVGDARGRGRGPPFLSARWPRMAASTSRNSATSFCLSF